MTHPFHALAGERLEILYAKHRNGALVFVCACGVGRTVTLPQAWTDRGEAPAGDRLSVERLGAARVLADALLRRGGCREEAQGEDIEDVPRAGSGGAGSWVPDRGRGVARAGDGAGQHGRVGAGRRL